MEIHSLCDIVRQTSFEIHCFLRHGHLEKIYENALLHRLTKLGLEVEQQFPLHVYDEDGTLLGDVAADLFVENRLIIDLRLRKTSRMSMSPNSSDTSDPRGSSTAC